MQPVQEARQLLASITLRQVLECCPPSAVVTLQASWSAAMALEKLNRTGLLSAPLFTDEEAGCDGEPSFLGIDIYHIRHMSALCSFLSIADIMAAFVDRCIELAGGAAGLEQHVEAAGAWLASTQAGSILRCNDAELVFGLDLSLLQLVQQALLNPPTKLFARRVAVVDRSEEDEGSLRIKHIITSFDLLQLLFRHREQLASLMQWTLGDLGFSPKPTVTVPASMSAVDCLATLFVDNCSAAGVVDSSSDGVLVSNLSASDLRGLMPDLFPLLGLPVADFLARRGQIEHGRNLSGFAGTHGIKSPGQLPSTELLLGTCTLDTRFGDLLEQLVQCHFHRSWLVDAEGRPIGVISITDILQLICG